MFRAIRSSIAKEFILLGLLLGSPCAMLAQRGAGGGRTGGALAGGGGLSGGNGKATGIDEKDDLKDFHAAMAVQASSQQIADYNSMMKITDNTSAELRAFLEHAAKPSVGQNLASSAASLAEAVERVRTENKNFLEGFSDKQRAGLKDIIKKLLKDDLELAQKSKALTVQAADPNAAASGLTTTTENLVRTLDIFRSCQVGLGEEMNIGANGAQSASYVIPAKSNSVSIENQPVTITTSGTIFAEASQSQQTTFKFEFTADMSNLQQNIAEILKREVDKSDACGEQIAVRSAILLPSAPSGSAEVRLHYERWACFGKGSSPNEMVEGDGTVVVKLTPVIGQDGSLHLTPAIDRVDAQGRVEELLRSGFLGELVRDKVTEAMLPILQQSLNYDSMIPAAAQGSLELTQVQFREAGAGNLILILDGDLPISSDKVATLTNELKAREAKTQSDLAAAPR